MPRGVAYPLESEVWLPLRFNERRADDAARRALPRRHGQRFAQRRPRRAGGAGHGGIALRPRKRVPEHEQAIRAISVHELRAHSSVTSARVAHAARRRRFRAAHRLRQRRQSDSDASDGAHPRNGGSHRARRRSFAPRARRAGRERSCWRRRRRRWRARARLLGEPRHCGASASAAESALLRKRASTALWWPSRGRFRFSRRFSSGTLPAWHTAASGQIGQPLREDSGNATGDRQSPTRSGVLIVARRRSPSCCSSARACSCAASCGCRRSSSASIRRGCRRSTSRCRPHGTSSRPIARRSSTRC